MTVRQRVEEIRQEVSSCQRCQLAKGRIHAVPGEGPSQVDIMFIGEAPGFHENRQGKPFVGQAGQFLDDLLQAAGVDRSQVFITNVVKCRPPNNRDPLPEELKACQVYLDEQISLLNPKVIVTLGRISMAKFVEAGRISIIHGKTHTVDGQKVVTMYHPAAALHQPALRQTLIEDFAKLKKFIGDNTPPAQTVQSKIESSDLTLTHIEETDIPFKEETVDEELFPAQADPIEDNTPSQPEQLSLF